MKKKFICTVCGYVHEGEEAPEKCPLCGAPRSKFEEMSPEACLQFVTEHEIGVAKGLDEEMIKDLGDCVWDTKTNLEKRMHAEAGANADKMRIAANAKKANLDAIHDTVHEMAKDEARHGRGFAGLYERFFGKK